MSLRGAAMSASGFGVARVRPLMGRWLEEGDEREGAASVVVIGEDVWRERLGGEAGILGRTVQLGAAAYEVVGVMPKGFAFPVNHQFWVPLQVGAVADERLAGPAVMVFGRLAPGATLASAQAELTAMGQRAAQALPKGHAPLLPRVMPYANPFLGMHDQNDQAGLDLMQGFATLLLVLVCLNVAILVYTRTATRQAEIGLRTALGASRGRIVGQLFLEALVLSAVAAAVGVGMAAFALRQIGVAAMQASAELPFWMTFQLVPEAVLYAVGLAVVAAAIVGVAPGLQATRSGVQMALRAGGGGGSGMRLGKIWSALIIVQAGFAVALLPPAVSSAWEDTRDGLAGLGFAAEEYLSAQLGMDEEHAGRFAGRHAELMRRLEAEPGVAGVAFGMTFPGDERNARVEVEGVDGDARGAARETAVGARYNRVDVHYLRSFGVPVLAGRGFEPADVAAGGRVIVNESMARQVWGGNALGRRVRLAGEERWQEVVGIVGDFPAGVSPKMDETKLVLYQPVAAGAVRPAALTIHMRHGAPGTFARRLEEIAAEVDADLQVRRIRGLDETMRSEQWITRLQAGLAGAVTLSVLLLASAGIYALMAFTVGQRKKEIGIRMALGAGRIRIIGSIFSRAFLQLGAGAAVGLALGTGIEMASGGELMRGNGAVVLPAVAVVIITAGLLAALGPARRSLRIEPVEALREP